MHFGDIVVVIPLISSEFIIIIKQIWNMSILQSHSVSMN